MRGLIGRWHRMRRAGLTLVECVLAITILPLAVTAMAYAIVAGQSEAVAAARQERATALSDALMEQILSVAYDATHGQPGAGRFRTIDDFNGLVQPAGQLQDAGGDAYPAEFQRFDRTVSVITSPTNIAPLELTVNSKRVTVSVSEAGAPVCVLTRVVLEPAG